MQFSYSNYFAFREQEI